MRIRSMVASATTLLVFAAAACGGEGEPARPAAPPPAHPDRVVSLSATATEMLFAIGAGGQVVAVDDQSNYPPQAPRTSLSALEPNVEAIAEHDPDMVVMSDAGGDVEPALESIGVDVLVLPAAESLDDTYAQLRELGRVTGHAPEADDVARGLQRRIAALAASLPTSANGATYYHELDSSYYTATSRTFIGRVYALLGLENIADAAAPGGGDYPQLSAELIIQADPDFIFLADTKCCGQSAETVAARPGWSSVSAVRRGAVIPLDDDIASRWGPRIVEFVEVVARSVASLEVAP